MTDIVDQYRTIQWLQHSANVLKEIRFKGSAQVFDNDFARYPFGTDQFCCGV